ncbi:MAG: hypothetical protein HYS12_16880 [Planctomycetes bacterium]|nr:hypothetical protein [Planctomycetota bacterium]
MDRHRMRGEGDYATLPQPAAPQLPLGAFILCPVPYGNPLELFWQQELYRWALAQAQAVVRPSLPERDLLGVWN